jgi:uncharacterized membrane protein YqjE
MSDADHRSGDVVTRPAQPDKSLGELFSVLTSDMSTLFRQEVALAKIEAKDEMKRGGKAAGMYGGAGLGGWMAVLFLSFALAWLLDQAMNTALAFAIVGVLWAIVAMVLLKRGKQQMAAVQPLPQTVQTLKEDAQWVKTQKS